MAEGQGGKTGTTLGLSEMTTNADTHHFQRHFQKHSESATYVSYNPSSGPILKVEGVLTAI